MKLKEFPFFSVSFQWFVFHLMMATDNLSGQIRLKMQTTKRYSAIKCFSICACEEAIKAEFEVKNNLGLVW